MVGVASSLDETLKVATALYGKTLTATSMMGLMMKNKAEKLSVRIKGEGPKCRRYYIWCKCRTLKDMYQFLKLSSWLWEW